MLSGHFRLKKQCLDSRKYLLTIFAIPWNLTAHQRHIRKFLQTYDFVLNQITAQEFDKICFTLIFSENMGTENQKTKHWTDAPEKLGSCESDITYLAFVDLFHFLAHIGRLMHCS